MTRLVGLKIQGVRSINDEPHIINFLNPLTIIQGENGTGKTTIIESLNYVTTGTLPSGRLNSFIHNNKLSKKKRVDALIQLHFMDFRGNDCVATKRMCAVESKNNKITTKSDEFTLKITETNGKVRSETAKVADFNRQIEGLFGVPAAILEHVIFCHQEDSTWPLGEPKELKTKFDAIFEVEKFVKVMDAIKKSARDFEGDLKVISAELPHLQKHMQHLGSVFMQLEENARKIVEIREYLKDKENEKMDLETQYKNLRKEKDRAANFEREIELKQKEIEVNQDTISKLEAGSEPYQGTKEDLMNELEAMKNSDEYTEAAAQKENAQKRHGELEKQVIPKLRFQMKNLQTHINKIESKKHLLDSLTSEREKIIADGLSGFRMKNTQPTDFASALGNEIKKAKTSLETFLAGKETQRQDLDNKRKAILEKIVTHTSTDKMKRAECAKLKEQISRLEKEIAKSENSGDKNTKVQNEMAKRGEQFTNLQSERTSKAGALKQKLFDLDVFPDVSTELTDVESVATRLDELYISQTKSFNEFIRETVGEKAVVSENTRRDLSERKAQLEEAQNEMKQAFQSIQPLKVEQKGIEEQLQAFNKSMETERTMISDKIQRMQSTAQRLNDVEGKLEAYQKEIGSSESADESREKLKEVEEQLDEAQAEMARLITVIAECDNRNQAIQKLESHLRFFDIRENITKLEKEVVGIKQSMTRPSQEFNMEAQKIAQQLNQLSGEMNKKRGAQSVLQNSEKDLRNQLKGEKIEDVKKQLKQKVIERVSMEAAIQDLRNLSRVMDECIISYHAQKMEQINAILNDLWPRVYQGNDIETIQIKSQSFVGNDKRKSYDYSVIMVVDQVEIEMRDRCSAGQKMLASILIRIALAEVFGGNCPILALDEPTTNLDSMKVENMGTILKDLLEACQTRDNRHNLQLIVITHDQRLVEHLFTACRPEYVYGLSKEENGTSRIRIHRNIDDNTFKHPIV